METTITDDDDAPALTVGFVSTTATVAEDAGSVSLTFTIVIGLDDVTVTSSGRSYSSLI